MKAMYRRPTGWRGHSHEHAMAARGIKIYASSKLVDPLFYASKREQELPSATIAEDVRHGATFSEMMRKHPHADKESMRLRSIKAIEAREGNNALSALNGNGVEASVQMARNSKVMRERMMDCLNDPQKASFLPNVKVDILKQRLKEI